MTDLRKAAEDILETLDKPFTASKTIFEAKEALRQALAQPEQEPFIYVREDNEKPFGGYEHCSEADAGAFPVYTAPPKREWVGITKEDKKEILEMTQPDERGYVIAITEAKLKEKNT